MTPSIEIITPNKKIKLDNDTKFIINFKMIIIIIGLLSTILLSGYGFINRKINKLDAKITLNKEKEEDIVKKVNEINTKLTLILDIYGINQPLTTYKNNSIEDKEYLSYQYHPRIPLLN